MDEKQKYQDEALKYAREQHARYQYEVDMLYVAYLKGVESATGLRLV